MIGAEVLSVEIPKKDHKLLDLQAKENSSQLPELSPKTDHYELLCVYINFPTNETSWIIESVGRYHERVCDPMTAKARVAE